MVHDANSKLEATKGNEFSVWAWQGMYLGAAENRPRGHSGVTWRVRLEIIPTTAKNLDSA